MPYRPEMQYLATKLLTEFVCFLPKRLTYDLLLRHARETAILSTSLSSLGSNIFHVFGGAISKVARVVVVGHVVN